MNELSNTIRKALEGEYMSDEELALLLSAEDEAAEELLYSAARRVRERHFGRRIFLYGFVYFSTWCRNQCRFCFYRQNNQGTPRYRKEPEEVLEIAAALQKSGVHLLDLTMGEDPYYLEEDGRRLVELVRGVKELTGLPLMVSPGVADRALLTRLREAGADWYACYQETHTRELYERLRPAQPYDVRFMTKPEAKEAGLLIEEGLLTGLGDQVADRIHSLRVMQALKPSQVRAMTFVPQPGTPLAELQPSGSGAELRLIAVMRLLFPQALIPASLDVEGACGMEDRLQAGANVVTSIIPSDAGLAGVAQSEKDIADGGRTAEGVRARLQAIGLEAASLKEYTALVSGYRDGQEMML